MSKKLSQAKESPSKKILYDPELGQRICETVASSADSLSDLCDKHDFFPNKDLVYQWRMKYPEFAEAYARAKAIQADILAESCLEIADKSSNATWGVDRLRIDTRKWIASKLIPRVYGDKFVMDHKAEESDQMRQELIQLREKLDKENQKDY